MRTAHVGSVVALTIAISGNAFAQSVSFDTRSYSVVGAPRAIVTADFNNDGHLDLATATFNGAANPGGIGILTNDGTGAFTLRETLQAAAGPFSIAAADFNRDGLPDLAVVAADANMVQVFMREQGTEYGFGAALATTTPASPRGVAAGDLNRDGRVDLAITSLGCACVSLLEGLGTGWFTEAGTIPVGTNPLDVGLADLDTDGLLDVVAAGSKFTMWFGGGSFQFARRQEIETGGSRAMTLADLNRNGRWEAISVNASNLIIAHDVGTNSGGGISGSSTRGSDTRGAGVTDMNGDGGPDLVFANRVSGTVTVLVAFWPLNPPSFTSHPGYSLAGSFRVGNGSRAVAIGDFNGDGRPDIATANDSAQTVSVLTNTTPFVGRP